MTLLTRIAVAVARGGVEVTDPTPEGCLEAELIELELRALLGDEPIDRVDVAVRLETGPSWRLQLAAVDRGAEIWRRELEAQPVDCPYLSQIVVMSVERGLSDLPGFLRPEPPPPPELAAVLSATLPWAVRIGLGGDLWVPSRRRWAWDSQLEAIYQVVGEVGPGRAQLVAVGLGTGIGVGLPLARHEVRLTSRIGSGASLVIGLGQDRIPLKVRPRLVWATDVGVAFRSGIRAGGRLEVNAARIRYGRVVYGEDRRVPEPLFRAGFAVSLGGALRRAE